MLTGLGPPAASSPSSEPSLPRLIRFSDRSLLRSVHGRPGKRARATPWGPKPATVAGADNPPPDAAIIYYNNTDGALAEADSSGVRGKMDCAEAKARDRKKHRCIMGKRTSPPQDELVRATSPVSGVIILIFLVFYLKIMESERHINFIWQALYL